MTTQPTPAPDAPDTGTAGPDVPPNTGTTATDQDADRAAQNAEAAKYRRQAREAQAELEKLKLATASDTERAIAAAKAEGAALFAAKWRSAVVANAALAVLAERGVTATEPALRSLDLDAIEVDEDGRFDRNAVAAKVDDLISRYPMFAGNASAAPSLPTVTGDGQRHLNPPTQRPTGKLSDAQAEAMLRYGMGGS